MCYFNFNNIYDSYSSDYNIYRYMFRYAAYIDTIKDVIYK